jgi:pimeloyl-ACP methyl ester carboxylesterase
MAESVASGAAPPAAFADHWSHVDGLRLFSRVCTTAQTVDTPPIVHVHGFAISGRYLEPTAIRLAARYPTYIPDLPGYGRSQKPARPFGIPRLAEALAGYLDAMELPRVVLVANSSGCLVAAELAHLRPERVERAVLVSPAGGRHNQPLPRGVLQLARDALREPVALTGIAVPDYLRFGPVNTLRAFHAMTRFPTRERLTGLPVPYVVVVGTRDPLVSRRRVAAIARSAPNIDDVYDVDAAHAINFSQPETLARIIDAYLHGAARENEPANTRVTTVPGGEAG